MTQIASALVRVSREIQETESQISEIKAIAQSMGYHIPDNLIFSEKITGMDKYGSDRKSIKDLKNALTSNKEITAVFAWELTRLSRNPYVLVEMLRQFNQEYKIPIWINDFETWTIDPITKIEDIQTTNKLIGAATYGWIELEKIKKRTKRGRDNKARKGLFVGHIADGYKVELIDGEKHIVIDNERVGVIKDIFNMYLNLNYSQNKIAQYLNVNNIPTFNANEAINKEHQPNFSQNYKMRGSKIIKKKTNTMWMGATISQVLRNRWYIGERTYNSQTYTHPAIINIDTFNAVQAKASSKAYNFSPAKNYYAVGGLVYCGCCGRKMFGHSAKLDHHYYCSSIDLGVKCGLQGLNKFSLDAIVWHVTRNIAIDNSVINDDMNNLTNYFKLDVEDINKLNKIIYDNEHIIQSQSTHLQHINSDLKELIKEKLRIKNKVEKQAVNELIESLSIEIEGVEKNIQTLNSEISIYKERINNNKNINNIIDKIININDKDIIKDILKEVVSKITIYNSVHYNKIIQIDYISNKSIYVIYNARKMHGKYIVLYHDLVYNSDCDAIYNPHQVIYINGGAVVYGDGDNVIDGTIIDGTIIDVEVLRQALREFQQPIINLEDDVRTLNKKNNG